MLWKFYFAASKIRAMQIRAMRNRASRGMTVVKSIFKKIGTSYNRFFFLQIRLPNHVGYILEYLVRFVIRLHLNPQQVECLMMRFVAALTHQCVDILGEYFF